MKWLKKKLGIDTLTEKISEVDSGYKKDYFILNKRLSELQKENNNLKEINKFIIDQFNVSADLCIDEYHRNWAVISIKGNKDYVRFIDLSQQDIRDIHMFLKRFDGTNRIIDSPFSFFKF